MKNTRLPINGFVEDFSNTAPTTGECWTCGAVTDWFELEENSNREPHFACEPGTGCDKGRPVNPCMPY